MLRIRREQMEALGSLMRADFERRMVTHLRRAFPKFSGRSDAEFLPFIRFGITRAAGYEIKIERDVQRYLEYMVMYGRQFDADPRYAWAAELLNAEGMTGTAKLDRIDEYDQFVLGR